MNRREFLQTIACAGGSTLVAGQAPVAAGAREPGQNPSEAAPLAERREGPAPRGLTVAGLQMFDSRDVGANERTICRAIDRAASSKVDFLLTPEGSLSGYYPGFDRDTVAAAVVRVARHAKEARVGLLLGTCFKELEGEASGAGAPAGRREYGYDQVRVYAPDGTYLGSHCKILLCSSLIHPGTGEISDYVAGTLRTFSWDGICFGVLICNDLWATPGFTTTPNPYLAWQLKTMGAQLLFHAVGTPGSPLSYRPYHEVNQTLWASTLRMPIVTANLVSGATPTTCRAGVVDADGERICVAPEVGEQFFSRRVPIA